MGGSLAGMERERETERQTFFPVSVDRCAIFDDPVLLSALICPPLLTYLLELTSEPPETSRHRVEKHKQTNIDINNQQVIPLTISTLLAVAR